jgi:hypothetical protein
VGDCISKLTFGKDGVLPLRRRQLMIPRERENGPNQRDPLENEECNYRIFKGPSENC